MEYKKKYIKEEKESLLKLLSIINNKNYNEWIDSKYIDPDHNIKTAYKKNTLEMYVSNTHHGILHLNTNKQEICYDILNTMENEIPMDFKLADIFLKEVTQLYNRYEYATNKIEITTLPKKWLDFYNKRKLKEYDITFIKKIKAHHSNYKGKMKKSNIILKYIFCCVNINNQLKNIPVLRVSLPLGQHHQEIYNISLSKLYPNIWLANSDQVIKLKNIEENIENSLENYYFNQVYSVLGKKEITRKKYFESTIEERENYKTLAKMLGV